MCAVIPVESNETEETAANTRLMGKNFLSENISYNLSFILSFVIFVNDIENNELEGSIE